MAGLRFSDLQARPTELLDLSSLAVEEFHCLVPAFETAFHTRMAMWRLDGKPRTARRFTVYTPCPLPTPEDRLLFILVYLKTYALQPPAPSAGVAAAPLLPTTGPNGGSSAPKIRLSRRAVIAARKSAIP